MSQTKAELIDAKGDAAFDTNTLFIDSANNRVGIGTSSPSQKLHVSASSGDVAALVECPGHPILRLKTTGTTDNTSVDFADSGSDTRGRLIYTHNNDLFQIYTAGTSALAINSSQRVGIGTTTVNTTLEVVNSSTPIIRVGDGTRHVQLWGGSSTQNQAVGTATAAAFGFNINSSEVARFDTSGRLLVGTSTSASVGDSAASRLQVKGNTGGSGTAAILSLQRDESPSSITSGEYLGTIIFTGGDGSPFAEITGIADGTAGTNDYPGRLTFSVTRDGQSSPTGRLRIINNGQTDVFGVGNCIGGRSSASAGTSERLFYGAHSATGFDNGTISFTVWSNGNVVNTNNSYGSISDIKLKENIVDANSQWEDIKALRPVNYNFKEGQTHTQLGLIAQEVELVCPGLVSETPDRDEDGNDLGTVTKSVNYSVLYMKAVGALQEAMERIEALEAKVAALESA